MFYSYDILNIRTGHLSLVWLAANRRLDYKRNRKNFRDLIGTNISVICDEIMKKIAHGKKSFHHGELTGSFSLYLSSMLMSGTVRIFENQVKFLLEEVTTAYINLRKDKKPQPALNTLSTDLTDKTQMQLEQLDLCEFGIFGNADTTDAILGHRTVPRIVNPETDLEMDVQRAVPVDNGLIDLNILNMDWTAGHDGINYPHTAHLNDITLKEPSHLVPTFQIDEFGPLDILQQDKPMEEIIREFDVLAEETNIPLASTPSHQQRVNEKTPARPPTSPTLLRPKPKNDERPEDTIMTERHLTSPMSKRPLDLGEDQDDVHKPDNVEPPAIADETDQPRAKRPRIPVAAEVEDDVTPANLRVKRIPRRKRKIAIDHFTSLTHDDLRKNRRYFLDTLRSDNPLLDVTEMNLYNNIIPANVLLKKYTRGMKLGKQFQIMLRTLAALSENKTDSEILRPAEHHESCLTSSLPSVQRSLQHTRSRLSKSLQTSASLLEPAVETVPESVPLHPITEPETTLGVPQDPSVFLANEGHVQPIDPESVVDKYLPSDVPFLNEDEFMLPPAFEPERRRVHSSPDDGPVYVQAEVDFHAAQTPHRSPQFSSPNKTIHNGRTSLPMCSPERFANFPEIPLSPIKISPSFNTRRVMYMEDTAANLTLKKLLPENATRKDVAGTLMRLLEMHKLGEVILTQMECYGEINVEVQYTNDAI